MIFQGANQTRECSFAKLLGFEHADQEGTTTFSVLNREKPTTIHSGPDLSADFDFRLDLALAHYLGDVRDLVGKLRGDLAKIAARPALPTASSRGQSALGREVSRERGAWLMWSQKC